MMRQKPTTAAELMAQLNSDPEWVAKRELEEREREAREAECRAVERPLVEELQAAGFKVDTAWDFVNTKDSYAEALPILLKHLDCAYPPAVREGIARAMAVPQSRFAWHDLVRYYRDEESDRVKDGLAVAIAATAHLGVLDELIALAKDRELGDSRLLLLRALARSTDPKARAALMELGTDPDLNEEIQVILKRLRSKGSKVAK